MSLKEADLAGPGIGNYESVSQILPANYKSLLSPRETMDALYLVKSYIEDNLNKEAGLKLRQPTKTSLNQ